MVIVITIIGLLSSIAVTKYSKVQENAKLNADYATASNLATAAMMAINNGETSVEPADLVKNQYIQFEPKSKSGDKGAFTITKGAGDSITVKVGEKVFYPKPQE